MPKKKPNVEKDLETLQRIFADNDILITGHFGSFDRVEVKDIFIAESDGKHCDMKKGETIIIQTKIYT